jgi:hypothetical protein
MTEAEANLSPTLAVLQLVRLKGRPTGLEIHAALGLPVGSLAPVLAGLTADGNLETVGDRFSLARDGRRRLDQLLDEERAGLDQDALATAYRAFVDLDWSFRQLITQWQVVDGTRPNDHTDAAYDGSVIERLVVIHDDVSPYLAEIGRLAPRLSTYPPRLRAALDKVRDGDYVWFARPLIDSYGAVWFELHQDLMDLFGFSRAADAVAG